MLFDESGNKVEELTELLEEKAFNWVKYNCVVELKNDTDGHFYVVSFFKKDDYDNLFKITEVKEKGAMIRYRGQYKAKIHIYDTKPQHFQFIENPMVEIIDHAPGQNVSKEDAQISTTMDMINHQVNKIRSNQICNYNKETGKFLFRILDGPAHLPHGMLFYMDFPATITQNND